MWLYRLGRPPPKAAPDSAAMRGSHAYFRPQRVGTERLEADLDAAIFRTADTVLRRRE
jgi:hypothetical protein